MRKKFKTIVSVCIVFVMLISQFSVAVSAEETNVESITATAQYTLIENYDGWDEGDYFYYSLDHCYPEYTVTMKDGTVYTGDNWSIYEAVGDLPSISLAQSAEHPLTVGTYTADVEICNVKGVCEIEIIENPVASVTATAQNTLIENYNGQDNGDYFYYYISNCNPVYTVTMKDGTVYTGDNWSIYEAVGYQPSISIAQSAEHPLTVGKYNAEVSFLGVTGVFEIEIIENPVASVTATAQNTLIENCNGRDNGDYFYYNLDNCNPEYTVTMKDGTVYTGSAWDIQSAIGYQPNISIAQSAEHPLTVGTYTADVEICNVKGVCEIEIIESPVASVTATAQNALVENYSGWNNGDYFYYNLGDCNIKYTVTMKDGTVYTGSTWEIQSAIGYQPSDFIAQSAEHPLTVGKYNVEVSFLGVKGVCEIEIIENPIASVTATAQNTLIENYNGYDNGDYFQYHINNCNPAYTVTMKDGTVHTGDAWDIQSAVGYWPSISIAQSAENPLTVGKHNAEISLLGVKGVCEIEIVENPIANVTIASKPLRYQIDSYDSNAIITVTYKDSTVYTGTQYEINKLTGCYPSMDWNEEDQKIGTNTGTITLFGKTFEFSYQIVENSYVSLEIVSVQPMEQSNSYSDPQFSYKLVQKDGTVEMRVYGVGSNHAESYLPKSVKRIGEWGPGKENKFTLTVAGLTAEGSVEITPHSLDYSYVLLDDNNAIITNVCNPTEVITIPEEIDGYTVIGISSLGRYHYTGEPKKIILPDSVEFLASNWLGDFSDSDLIEQIIIGKGVQNLDHNMFKGLSNLKKIDVSGDNPFYKSVNGVVYTKDMSTLVVYPLGGEENYVVPKETSNIDVLNDVIYDGINISFSDDSKNYVTKDGVTYTADMKRIISCSTEKSGTYVMPQSVEQINDRAFADCNKLESVSVSKNVTEIPYGAFADCTALKNITLPNGVKSIGRQAFANCTALPSIDLPGSVETIGERAFENCSSITEFTIPDLVTTLNGALGGCTALKTLNVGSTFNDGFSEIDSYFGLESITNINISEGNATYSSIDGVVYSKDKTEIIKYPCARTATEFTIPDGVKTVSYDAFDECSALAKINFPDSLEYADRWCFGNTAWYKENKDYENGVLYAGKCLLDADSDYDFGNYAIKQGTKTIADGAFSDCTTLTSVTIPDSVTEIGSYAFYGCPLEEVKLPKGLKTIGQEAFTDTNIERIEIPDTVTDMVYGFQCSNISEIKMPNKLVTMTLDFEDTPWLEAQSEGPVYLGRMLYKYKGWMKNYSTVTVKNGTLGISGEAFAEQNNLININLPEGLLEIGTRAFSGCTNLKSPVLPSTLKTIREDAFSRCYSMDSITIPASVTEIEDGAFYGCVNLKEINVSPDNPVYSSIDGALYNKDGTELLYCPEGKTGTLVLPSQTVKIHSSKFGSGGDSLSAIVINNDNLEACPYIGTNCWYGNVGTAAYDYAKSMGYIVFIPLNNLTDNKTGISVSETVPNGVAEGSVLTVQTVEKTDSKVTYNISLIKDGAAVQPTGAVTVKIPVPNTMNGSSCRVYRQEADGTYTNMKATYQDGYMVFTTDHFSVYVLTTETLAAIDGDVNGDGKVNAVDARWVLQASSGARKLDGTQSVAADVNRDGKVNAVDARWILQVASGARKL